MTGANGCGIDDAVRLAAVITKDKMRVAITPPATLRCAMAEAVAHWVRDDVAPIAATLGAPLGGIANYAAYECRGRNRIVGAQISEHGKGNALDIRALTLTNGKSYELTDIAVAEGDARAAEGERLRALHDRARAGLGRLSRGPCAYRHRGAAQRLSHLPMGGARCVRPRAAAARAPAGSAEARTLTIARPVPARAGDEQGIAMSHDADGFAQAPPGAPPRRGDCSARSLWGTLGVVRLVRGAIRRPHRVHRVARHG